ncbi:uncharacterized protein BXIN_1343 [Babesia sp. Xinjiang]|uniref:uncharacterized protein n=1 Tax=Babesia sp. Xinjiang TaxID=462227 RepID=UPI000A23A9D1|nr:uncharacterized protein BXIN_1343 [Babesia sp. Xinjiang]ORM39891.1 hypothetical protein BXIN_1343 [Babesia sp. Xinjiang]
MAPVEAISQHLAEKLHISAPGSRSYEDQEQSKPVLSPISRRFCHIHDMTIHTIRQAWILLLNSTAYKFNGYLEGNAIFPDVKQFFKYTKYSAMLYTFNYAVALILCDLVKYEWPHSTKKGFGKGTGRPKPEPYAVVILAMVVLPSYRGINLSKHLFQHTVKKANEARIYKMFAVADEKGAEVYAKLGFTTCETSPVNLDELRVTKADGSKVELFVMENTIFASQSA